MIKGFINIIKIILLFAVIAAVAFWVYHFFKNDEQPELTKLQHQNIESLSYEVGKWSASMNVPRKKTLFCKLERDHIAEISDGLRHVIQQTDRFDLVEDSVKLEFQKKLKLNNEISSRSLALKRAVEQDCNYVIWGKVLEFSSLADKAYVKVSLELLDVSKGELIAKRLFTAGTPLNNFQKNDRKNIPIVDDEVDNSSKSNVTLEAEKEQERYSLHSDNSSKTNEWKIFDTFPSKILLWLIILAVIPILFSQLANRILKGDSNISILLLLTSLVLISSLIGFRIIVYGSNTFFSGIVMVGIFVVSFVYNYLILSSMQHAEN